MRGICNSICNTFSMTSHAFDLRVPTGESRLRLEFGHPATRDRVRRAWEAGAVSEADALQRACEPGFRTGEALPRLCDGLRLVAALVLRLLARGGEEDGADDTFGVVFGEVREMRGVG